MLIEVPNAVNLLKRIKVPLGKTNYPPYEEFFTDAHWMGHVREYSIGDLTALARLLGFRDWKIYAGTGTARCTSRSEPAGGRVRGQDAPVVPRSGRLSVP